MARIVLVEPDLHDDGPDVDAGVQDDNGPQPHLSSTSLADALEIKDESQAKASHTLQACQQPIDGKRSLEALTCRKRGRQGKKALLTGS